MRKIVVGFMIGVALTLAAALPAKANWFTHLIGLDCQCAVCGACGGK